MSAAPRAVPEPSDNTVIEIETLVAVKVHVNNAEADEAVVQFTTEKNHIFLAMHVDELGRLGERLVLDSKLLSSGAFTGRA